MPPICPLAHELPVVGFDGNQLSINAKVRRASFTPQDGPRFTGSVKKIEWPRDQAPVVVVKMLDGHTEHWHTEWTSEGPWDLQAPFKTGRGKVVR